MSVSVPQDKKLLKRWRELVLERDGHICQVCGLECITQCHHFFGRRSRPNRWNPDNGIMLCSGHHKMSSKFSAHETPSLFVEWFKEKYPERFERITLLHQTPFKGSYEDVLKIQDDSVG